MATSPPPLRALVVDDEAPALDELAWLLERDPNVGRVRTAASGAEALRALESEPVDVVFCDVQMPGLDGLDLARVLARFSHRPHVVFVTAYEQHAIEAFDLRATDYVLKPVRADRLAEAVRRVVESGTPGARGAGRPRTRRSRSSSAASPGSCSARRCASSRPTATTPGCTPAAAATWCGSR